VRLRVVFDLDGTLVDSAASLTAAVNALLAGLDRPPLEEAAVRGFIGHGVDALVDRVLTATGGIPPGGPDPQRARFRAIYAADPVGGVVVYDGAREALAALAAAGHGLAVCTQKPDEPARRLLASLGLMPPVEGLTAGDSLPALKPDPRLLEHAASQIGSGPVVMVGDSEVDAATAANAGVPFVLRLGGYHHGPAEAIPRAAAFADFAELPALLARLAEEPVEARP
jgi:phosphoglycolate phosphatase